MALSKFSTGQRERSCVLAHGLRGCLPPDSLPALIPAPSAYGRGASGVPEGAHAPGRMVLGSGIPPSRRSARDVARARSGSRPDASHRLPAAVCRWAEPSALRPLAALRSKSPAPSGCVPLARLSRSYSHRGWLGLSVLVSGDAPPLPLQQTSQLSRATGCRHLSISRPTHSGVGSAFGPRQSDTLPRVSFSNSHLLTLTSCLGARS